MPLSPLSHRDWTDPPWHVSNPDPEENILTSLRLKSERGRGCHKVNEPALKQYFVTMTTNIVSKLSDEESAKIDFTLVSSSLELKDVYVTINQCTVSRLVPNLWCALLLIRRAVLTVCVLFLRRLSNGFLARILMISIMR